MFNNRLVTLLVGLGIVMLALLSIGAVISTHQVASSGGDNHLAPLDWYLTHDHAILGGDNTDAAQFAGAKITAADEEDSYLSMQPSAGGWWEYRDDSLTNNWYAYHYVTTPSGPVIDAMFQGKSEGVARSEAAHFAGANITAADEADLSLSMQPSASGWWEYRDDSLTNNWYAYHYVMTPTGPVIDAMFQGKSE